MPVKKKYNRKWLRLIFLLYPIASLIGFMFPFIPAYFINRALAKIKGFFGHIDGIRISPFVINIKVKGFFLDIVNEPGGERSRFISFESIDITIDWAKLWSGMVYSEVKCTAPSFTFSKESSTAGKSGNPLFAFDPGIDIIIDKLDISNGKIEFIDTTTKFEVLLHVHNIDVTASTLPIGSSGEGNILTDIFVKADLYSGKLLANMKVDLLSLTPDFKLDTRITDVNMVLLNDFFRTYGKFDVHNGTMAMRTVVTAKDGKFTGYVESIIKDLEIMGPEDTRDNILKFLWKALIGTITELIEDHSKDELAVQVNFEAPFKNPEVHIGIAVLEVLTNAFLHGLTPYMKNEVKIDL